jgi:MFS family permease
LGLACLILADAILARSTGLVGTFCGVGLCGAHLALTQGLFAKRVTDTAPARLRGSAFGLFSLVAGVSLLVASIVAGLLWDNFGASMTFDMGAIFAALSGAMLLLWRRPKEQEQR